MTRRRELQLSMSESGGGAVVTEMESPTSSTDLSSTHEALIATIYEVVADSMGLDPSRDRIPIHDSIDPEAMARVFENGAVEGYVSFPVEDRRVTVHSDGSVIVHDSLEI